MAVTLNRLVHNVLFQQKYCEKRQVFTIAEVTLENLWNYPLTGVNTGSFKVVDTNGYQYNFRTAMHYRYGSAFPPGSKEAVEIDLEDPDLMVEAHAKTRGWLWFDALPENVFVHRLIYRLQVFDPGRISGIVRDGEMMEFVINHQNTTLKQLPQ